MNEFVTLGAIFQLVLPTWPATIRTVPAPLKVTFVPPEILAGPALVVKLTGKPELADALSPSLFVVICVPGFGKFVIV